MPDTKRVVTFGEIMLRLAPYNYERLIQAQQFQVNYGGSEANVAASLSMFGEETCFVSQIPDSLVGDAALNSLRSLGVRTEHILRGGSRLGIYFLEHGAAIRSSKVVYDRANSSMSQVRSGMIDWNSILFGKDWFHITGITPALSNSCAVACIEAITVAKSLSLTTSCDLNYRKKLFEAVPSLLLIVIVIGGIVSGIFTATEASAIAVLYSLMLSVMVYREIKVNELPQILLKTVETTAIVMLLIGTSSAMSWILSYENIP